MTGAGPRAVDLVENANGFTPGPGAKAWVEATDVSTWCPKPRVARRACRSHSQAWEAGEEGEQLRRQRGWRMGGSGGFGCHVDKNQMGTGPVGAGSQRRAMEEGGGGTTSC